jgi:hypothetical protein
MKRNDDNYIWIMFCLVVIIIASVLLVVVVASAINMFEILLLNKSLFG